VIVITNQLSGEININLGQNRSTFSQVEGDNFNINCRCCVRASPRFL